MIHSVWAPPGWLSGERVGFMTWWLRVRSPLRRLFFPANFRLLPLQKHVRKVVGGFGKKSCISTGVRKPGNIIICVTKRHDMALAVKVASNPNTTNILCGIAASDFERIFGGVLIKSNYRKVSIDALATSI